MDNAQADRAAFDTAERLVGAPLDLPLGQANRRQAQTSGGLPPGMRSETPDTDAGFQLRTRRGPEFPYRHRTILAAQM